jgi:SAM-dependent MidA family methyltransferase
MGDEDGGASRPWRVAMAAALYGPDGFYTRPGPPRGGGGHFRTSAHASAHFANALLRLVVAADEALDRPDPLVVYDIGAGGAHLLRRLAELAPAYLGRRLRLTAVELAPPPAGLPDLITWQAELPPPASVVGVVLATEWLDNIALDVATAGKDFVLRYTLVDPLTGKESAGEPLTEADLAWARQWWPALGWRSTDAMAPDAAGLPDAAGSDAGWPVGFRVELGIPRDTAWAEAVGTLQAGLAVTVDYGHVRVTRPLGGSLTGYFAGRMTPAIPDGTADITAHVAVDSAATAGEAVAGEPALLLTQREALARLGVQGSRPPLDLAHRDPQAYIRGLSGATQAMELTDPRGLGGHYWIVQPVGLPLEAFPVGWD